MTESRKAPEFKTGFPDNNERVIDFDNLAAVLPGYSARLSQNFRSIKLTKRTMNLEKGGELFGLGSIFMTLWEKIRDSKRAGMDSTIVITATALSQIR